MSGQNFRKTADQLDEALKLLDHELAGLKLEEPLHVRAIGGYALLKHGVRKGDRAYTVDIDTVTKDYGRAVESAVKRVADELGLDSNWLNNDNVLDNDPEHVESLFQADWEPQPMGLRNIAVSIASIKTLTRAKISATDESEFNDRLQDAQDLKDLIEFQGIKSLADFRKVYPDPDIDFPETQRVLRAYFSPGSVAPARTDRFPELHDVELDAYGLGEDVDEFVDEPDYFR